MKALKTSILTLVIMSVCMSLSLAACSDEEITRPPVTKPVMPDKEPEATDGIINMDQITRTTAFNSGSDGINSFRIPSIVTANDGSLLVFGEARRTTWIDKSETNIAVKRSTDAGATWSAMTNLTASANVGGTFAYMDPTAVVDRKSGKIWVYFVRWPKSAANAAKNRAFVCTSTDNGATWDDTPIDVTDQIVAPDFIISGFGPGSGFQIKEGSYANRLIVPTRQTRSTLSETLCTTVYSDNQGSSWSVGEGIKPSGESQMADCGDNKLTLNIRAKGGRRAGFSTNGGRTWSVPDAANASVLPGIDGGCQASVWGVEGNTVLFCGIKGGTATNSYDDRSNLMLYRSMDGAVSWTKNQLLYEKAAGYCCMTTLNDGRIAIVFEAANTDGFSKAGSRPAGWMRLDVMVLPKEVTDRGYWFEQK